jgi:hypothetical protein
VYALPVKFEVQGVVHVRVCVHPAHHTPTMQQLLAG